MSVTPIITEAMQEYDPLFAEFERGRSAGLRQARAEYRRGFTDATIVAFVFMTLGAVIVALLTSVFA